MVQDSAHPPLGRIDFIPWVIFLIPFGFTGALRPRMLHVYGTAVAVVSISVFLFFVVAPAFIVFVVVLYFPRSFVRYMSSLFSPPSKT